MTAAEHRAECVRLLRLALEHANQGGDATPFPNGNVGVYAYIDDALFMASGKDADTWDDTEVHALTGEWPDWIDPFQS